VEKDLLPEAGRRKQELFHSNALTEQRRKHGDFIQAVYIYSYRKALWGWAHF
jgi:hypothetical protein